MKFIRNILLGLAASVFMAGAALAQANGVTYSGTPLMSTPGPVGLYYEGQGSAASQTFATNSFADLAGASVTFNMPNYDATIYGGWIWVTWDADVSKAIAGTGTCGVYVNGALVAATEHSIGAAGGAGTISGQYMVKPSAAGSQTVKLQCESSETNTFTVTNAHLTVFAMTGRTPYNP